MPIILRPAFRLFAATFFVLLSLLPERAEAQYKNSAFALDVGYGFLSRPSLSNNQGGLLSPTRRPNRLARLWRVGGEGDFKLHHDHWWFTGRVDLNFPNYGSTSDPGNNSGLSYEPRADYLASQNMGFILGTEAMMGIRYYILTDHVRPYAQLSISYQHLFSFGGASDTCDDPAACPTGGSYAYNFLPHQNLLGVHVVPGIEFLIAKDLAIHVIADMQRWIVFSSAGNNIITLAAGLTFFS